MSTLAPGTRVVLSRVRHDFYRGKVSTVKRYIKSRGVYDVQLDNPDGDPRSRYDALPQNVDVAP